MIDLKSNIHYVDDAMIIVADIALTLSKRDN